MLGIILFLTVLTGILSSIGVLHKDSFVRLIFVLLSIALAIILGALSVYYRIQLITNI